MAETLAAAPAAPHHRHEVRVYYEDTDAGGIVYHANYLKFAERARTEMLRRAGYDHPGLMRAAGAGFAVSRCAMDFRRPATLDARLAVDTAVTRLGGARMTLTQTIRRLDPAPEATLVAIDIELALIDGCGRPMRIPRDLAEAMRRMTAPPDGG